MNDKISRVLRVTLILCVAGLARQAMSADLSTGKADSDAAQTTRPSTDEAPYIKRGYYDLAFSGGFARYHYDGGSSSGGVSADLGYYLSNRVLLGAGLVFTASTGVWAPGIRGHFRYLIPTRNPRAFIFLGAIPEYRYAHLSRTASANDFLLRNEAGLKYFVARNVSVETAYNLAYARQTGPFTYGRFTSSISTGLGFTFGH